MTRERAQVSPFPMGPTILVVAVAIGISFETIFGGIGFGGGLGFIAAGTGVALAVIVGGALTLEWAVNRTSP